MQNLPESSHTELFDGLIKQNPDFVIWFSELITESIFGAPLTFEIEDGQLYLKGEQYDDVTSNHSTEWEPYRPDGQSGPIIEEDDQ